MATLSSVTIRELIVQPAVAQKHATEEHQPLQKVELVECGYTCRDDVWYKAFKLTSPNGRSIPSLNERLTNSKYICRDGVWYKQIDISGLDLEETTK